jgi:hypothetical protein
VKQFKSKINGDSIHVYAKDGEWFVKKTKKGQWISRVPIAAGPFSSEGDALLACAMARSLGFNNYKQVYP